MTTCPRLQPNTEVIAYMETLPPALRRKLPIIVPYWWSIDRIQSKVGAKVIRFPMAVGQVAA